MTEFRDGEKMGCCEPYVRGALPCWNPYGVVPVGGGHIPPPFGVKDGTAPWFDMELVMFVPDEFGVNPSCE